MELNLADEWLAGVAIEGIRHETNGLSRSAGITQQIRPRADRLLNELRTLAVPSVMPESVAVRSASVVVPLAT